MVQNGHLRRIAVLLRVIMLGFAVLLSGAVAARADESDLCLSAAAQAARESGVPYPVLLAITQTETGRRRAGVTKPWPWPINIEGAGHWFDTRSEAENFAQNALADGRRSFDVGCFQINYRWHGMHFASLSQMFDPLTNARYAAKFLGQMYAETGDWSRAAGAYHSRTPEFAQRYRVTFDRHYAAAGQTPAPTTPTPVVQVARAAASGTPLFQGSTGRTALGSLVPLSGIVTR